MATGTPVEFICVNCRKLKAKSLQKEERPYFCASACAVAWALATAIKVASCPKCGSHFTHMRSGGYAFDHERRCSECCHKWET